MIYTLTMNPAIDLFCHSNDLKPEIVNRTLHDDIQANGKGVNVSFVLKLLSINSTAYGFSAGFTGDFIKEQLQLKGINEDFIDVDGTTRINIFVKVDSIANEYKIVNPGPYVTTDAQNELLKKIEELNENDILCVSGSLPRGCEPQLLVDIAKICHNNKVRLVMDTSYKEVLECLTYQPYLLKPNDEELEKWFDIKLESLNDYLAYARKLLEGGAQKVLLSLGGEGAVYMDDTTTLIGNAPSGEVINTACAGDTLLATFLAYQLKGESLVESLKQGIAAGSSTAFREGITDFSDTKELAQQIKIKKMEE